jgi:hypothetical protein
VNIALINKSIHNYSSFIFSASELNILSYGLSFVPSPRPPTFDSIVLGIAKLKRAMRLRWHFRNKAFSKRDYNPKTSIPNSDYKPPKAHSGIESYLRKLQASLLSRWHSLPKFISKNYRTPDMRALVSLASRADLVICDTDKNLGGGIFNFSDINTECLRQLNDSNTYQQLTFSEANDLITEFIGRITVLYNKSKVIFQDSWEFISKKFDTHVSFPAWYILPKILKTPWTGRPICPSFKWVTHELSVWLSVQFCSVIPNLKTVLKDTICLVRDLESTPCPPGHVLGTADVVSLYPSIAMAGVIVVKKVLTDFTDWSVCKIETIISALLLVLTFNVFTYGSNFFRQIKGTAMGTPTAPDYANIFMFGIEWDYCRTFAGLLYFKRYIDDCFFMVLASRLAAFQAGLQGLYEGIVFTFGGSDLSCIMLDLFIFKGLKYSTNGLLDFKVYQKKFNSYLYIPFFSDHPRSVKKGFIFGELGRYARNSALFQYFSDIRFQFFARLRLRGYPKSFLLPLFNSVFYRGRIPQIAKQSSDAILKPLLFNVPFSRYIVKMSPGSALHDHWDLVKEADPLGSIFPSPPLIVFSKGRSVFDIVRSIQKKIVR